LFSFGSGSSRLLKNIHLLRFPHPSPFSIPGTRSDPFGLPEHVPDASRLRVSGALHLGIFEQPVKETFSTCFSSFCSVNCILKCNFTKTPPLLSKRLFSRPCVGKRCSSATRRSFPDNLPGYGSRGFPMFRVSKSLAISPKERFSTMQRRSSFFCPISSMTLRALRSPSSLRMTPA